MAITIIGAGLSGSEAAWAAANLGIKVNLYEMRPQKMTPAHKSDKFAELVCSNSLGGESDTNAKGLLQAEMLAAKSLVMQAAHQSRLPAGGALAVEREEFSSIITQALKNHPNITIHPSELTKIPTTTTVLASGPLSSEGLSESIKELVGMKFLSFYDAAAPIISFESINMNIAFKKGRYNQRADYINIPFNKKQYYDWYHALTKARKHSPHAWEKLEFFEGCMPIEEIARRGIDTPRFGPLKPVGLEHPETDERFYAVAQLRQEDRASQMWSIVGFQTGLKWGDQKEIVRMMPGLENAEIIRYGVMHRNTYLNAPKLLSNKLNLKENSHIFVAGVLAGTEGYLESAATGWLAGTNAARQELGLEEIAPPKESMLGGLVHFLETASSKNFQPMNANWGLVPSIPKKIAMQKKERRQIAYQTGLDSFKNWLEQIRQNHPL